MEALAQGINVCSQRWRKANASNGWEGGVRCGHPRQERGKGREGGEEEGLYTCRAHGFRPEGSEQIDCEIPRSISTPITDEGGQTAADPVMKRQEARPLSIPFCLEHPADEVRALRALNYLYP